MYILLWILVLVSAIAVYRLYHRETFESEKNEDLYTYLGLNTRLDEEALKQYCDATDRSLETYTSAIITPTHTSYLKPIVVIWNQIKQKEEWIKQIPRWSVAITDGSIEYGYAFTVGWTMYLPLNYLQGTEEAIHSLFIHELRHIWQRMDYRRCLRSLDPYVWRGWRYQVVSSVQEGVSRLRSYSSKKNRSSLVFNPDTIQVMAFSPDSDKHPVYPIREGNDLVYMVRNHTQRNTWADPHPCEWDAREIAENILRKE